MKKPVDYPLSKPAPEQTRIVPDGPWACALIVCSIALAVSVIVIVVGDWLVSRNAYNVVPVEVQPQPGVYFEPTEFSV